MSKQLTHGADSLVATATITTGTGEEWMLNYYLQQFTGTEAGLEGVQLYGLRVDKSTPDGVLADRAETPPVTQNHSLAMEMANAFANGQVTPLVLLEIADDWLQSKAAV